MNDPNTLLFIIGNFNINMDKYVPRLFAIWLAIVILKYTRDRIGKEGFSKGLYLGIGALAEAGVLVATIYVFPQKLEIKFPNTFSAYTFRWIVIYLILVPYSYFSTRKHSSTRGPSSVLMALNILLLGWLYDHWVGILFISMPILLMMFYTMNQLAEILLPASDPESKTEARQKRKVFFTYLFGTQHPIWVAAASGRGFDRRIPGDVKKERNKPGVVLTHSHQVAGMSKGTEFNRVDGPGLIFTEPYEEPFAVVDLRTQIRFNTIDTVTKDGMVIPAVVYAVFAVDSEKWPKDIWPKAFFSSLKFQIGKDIEIDHTEGGYPYSTGRVRALLSRPGVNISSENEKPEVYWDEWVQKQVEYAAQQMISERSLDELWRPRHDRLGASALDEIAEDLKESLYQKLAAAGINLFAAGVADYVIAKDNPIAEQNLKTWSSRWQQKITVAKADIESIYREEIEKAHAYSKSVLLSAIADAITKAHSINDSLPRHVIAQYFAHALEEYIKKQPGMDVAESKQRMESLKDFLYYNRTEGSE